MNSASQPVAHRWLLGLAAGTLSPDELRGSPDVAALADELGRWDGRLMPVTLAGLRSSGVWAQLGDATREAANRRMLSAVALHLRQRAWLSRFVREQLPADLPVLLLKGAALNGVCYAEAAPRTGGDIDLLARPADFKRLCALLGQHATPVPLYDGRPFSRDTRFERGFWIDQEHTLCVEPHRHLVQPGLVQIPPEDLWARSVAHPAWNDERVRMLDPVDTLLHLTAHALTNQNCAPHALVDAARLVRHTPPDPVVLMQRAAHYGLATAVGIFLQRVAHEVQGAADILPATKHSVLVRWLAQRALPADRHTDDRDRAAFRGRQLLALGLLDRPLRALPFLLRYALLRVEDTLSLRPANAAPPVSLPELGERFVWYRGISMYPTFHDRELLRIEPPGSRGVLVGDVIVFAGPTAGHWIIHRVVGMAGERLLTRGDNNDRVDVHAPTLDMVRGRVVSVCTQDGDRPVAGGTRGRRAGRWMRWRNGLARFVAPLRHVRVARPADMSMQEAEG